MISRRASSLLGMVRHACNNEEGQRLRSTSLSNVRKRLVAVRVVRLSGKIAWLIIIIVLVVIVVIKVGSGR